MKKVLLFLLFFIFICFLAGRVFAADRVEINTASLQQLETLTGIGPVKAQAIIDARPFSSVDDLVRVSGIKTKTLQGIKDQGLAYVSGQAPQAPATAENSAPVKDTVSSQNLAQESIKAPSEPAEAISYPTDIYINEILPNPEGPDETDEWIVPTIQQIASAYS